MMFAALITAALAQTQPVAPAPSPAANPAGVSVALAFMAQGAAEKSGRYTPVRTEMAPPAQHGAMLPETLLGPLVGTLTIDGSVAFAWGQNAGGDAMLLVDTNRNNDLRDDTPATLTQSRYGAEKKYTRSDGSFTVNIGTPPVPYSFIWFRFDPADPQRAHLARTLHYYRDYGRVGRVTLDGKDYGVLLMDDRTRGSFDSTLPGSMVNLYIDINADDQFEARGEVYDATQPFNIAGHVYELKGITADGAALRFTPSDKVVDEVRMPPNHRVGGVATPFLGTTTDGKQVKFPEDFKGSLVLLDFWATWCMPCLQEMPNVVKARKDFGERGFKVLGVSLDSKHAEAKIASTTERLKMDWPQVYDGGQWSSRVPQLYEIASIPAAFLVDGDTGRILAVGADVRGDSLARTVEQELKARGR